MEEVSFKIFGTNREEIEHRFWKKVEELRDEYQWHAVLVWYGQNYEDFQKEIAKEYSGANLKGIVYVCTKDAETYFLIKYEFNNIYDARKIPESELKRIHENQVNF